MANERIAGTGCFVSQACYPLGVVELRMEIGGAFVAEWSISHAVLTGPAGSHCYLYPHNRIHHQTPQFTVELVKSQRRFKGGSRFKLAKRLARSIP